MHKMDKAINICFIVFAILYFVGFVFMVAGGIIPLALSHPIIEEMMKSDPNMTELAAQTFIASWAASMFLSSTVFLFAACTCLVSKAKVDKGNLTFRSKLTIGIFNTIIGSTPSGVLLIVEAALQRHRKEI